MIRFNRYGPVVLLCCLLTSPWFLVGCGGGTDDPIKEINKLLKGVPTYSIILADMNEEGNFLKSYYHKYQILTPEKTADTEWKRVSKEFYQQYLPFLGMTIYTKKDGKSGNETGPPGYQYVGDDRYGEWQRDSSGNSFWVFYGQYAMLSHLLGGGPIYRRDYDQYQSYRSQGRPYYGPNKEYGTSGSYTQKQRPDFYSRRMSRQQSSSSSFGSKVDNRIGRTKSSTRSRSSSAGK